MKEGFLISFEGIDGCGKSTQANMLYNALHCETTPCVLTSEPADNPIGQLIRLFCLQRDTPPKADALMFAADRIVHCEEEISLFLKRGIIVITDRYNDSSIAYQHAQGLDINWIKEINKYAIVPKLTFIIDIDADISLERVKKRSENKDKFEKLEFMKKIRQNFLDIAKENPKRVILIDGNQEKEKIHELIVKYVQEYLDQL